MSFDSQNLDYTDEAWWEPSMFEMDNDQLVTLFSIIESDDLDDCFYPEKAPIRIRRRAKQFSIDPVFSYFCECFGGDALSVFTDKHHRQSVLIAGSNTMGDYYVLDRLPNRRPETIWPHVENALLEGTISDYVIEAEKEPGVIDSHRVEPWDFTFLFAEFTFYGNRTLEKRMQRMIQGLYRIAPADCLLKQEYPTAEEWLQQAGID
jgi:hypothetical protein